MSDSMSQHCPNCEAQAAEIERLREILKIADEYITDLDQHEGAEGFSVSTYELGKKYEAALGEGND